MTFYQSWFWEPRTTPLTNPQTPAAGEHTTLRRATVGAIRPSFLYLTPQDKEAKLRISDPFSLH